MSRKKNSHSYLQSYVGPTDTVANGPKCDFITQDELSLSRLVLFNHILIVISISLSRTSHRGVHSPSSRALVYRIFPRFYVSANEITMHECVALDKKACALL